MTTADPDLAAGTAKGGVHRAQRHDSALKHATGEAVFIDDMPEPAGLLHAALVLSPVAHGRLRAVDLTAARAADGVVAALTAADVPGRNDIAPVRENEPLFADALVEHAGQPIAAIAATSLDAARAAAKKAVLDIEALPAVLTIDQAVARQSLLYPPVVMARGDADAALGSAPHRLSNSFRVGGQEHFYLEGQVALALPGEDGDLIIHSSTQHPTEVQHIVARVLGLDYNQVTVMVRRMGGAFGGKESNASWVAAAAALLARATGRPVKLRLPRAHDMVATGKRHGFLYRYTVGFDDDGRVLGLDATLAANGGHSVDLTPGVLARALTHVDNVYWVPHIRCTGLACKTNTVSNTAFRGFGGPQGVVVMEDAIGRIAHALGKTAEAVRAVNFYGEGKDDETPYGQKVEDNLIRRCVAQVARDSDWDQRRAGIDAFNRGSAVIKRGLGQFPLKFGISFNIPSMNQAGALVHVYSDGSVRLNHGGTEMGQGLFVKVAQVVAEVFQVDLDRIRVTATSTGEVPNTSPTAASTGSDLNGWAAFAAANTIRQRMAAFAAGHFDVPEDTIAFRDNHVHVTRPGDNRVMAFGELARLCHQDRVSLSATGFYKTPKIHWDAEKMNGRPFFYFSYGAAVAEVAIDTLTGEMRVLRVDLVQDCGRSLNPAVDRGQIEGAFAQGMGWLTCEELWWDPEGRLRTAGPSTYKIPGSRDMPPIFNVRILQDAPAREATIFRSKAIGEPPLMLATAVWTALKDAIASVVDHQVPVTLDAPATPERVLMTVQAVRQGRRTI
ncbi:xanthine dehydrogenase molybdopterin binding subunit [Vineibacter terrae]|uniref:Xanthine dehydrogenase molybdopterin binding subunit n=1 Tax=Vineibacter terrae TaxID=2586908 RepID=A0A5C8PJ70_9HYPH|nr:xanthine dehydrogenase molybdopterin binding subunit [Vineibacter terrae]TXL73857.1 xanthine dehydrogenase molybdopterin binding subunit [Vineibacter terrae]